MAFWKKPHFSYLTFYLNTSKAALLLASGFEAFFSFYSLFFFAVFWLFQDCQERKHLQSTELAV